MAQERRNFRMNRRCHHPRFFGSTHLLKIPFGSVGACLQLGMAVAGNQLSDIKKRLSSQGVMLLDMKVNLPAFCPPPLSSQTIEYMKYSVPDLATSFSHPPGWFLTSPNVVDMGRRGAVSAPRSPGRWRCLHGLDWRYGHRLWGIQH